MAWTTERVQGAPGSEEPPIPEKFRPKQPGKRFPTSAYLPGFRSNVKSRECPRCGFEAFSYAKACRCGYLFGE